MGRKCLVMLVAVMAATSALVVGSSSAGAEDTDTQFTITGGTLAISVPSSKDLGAVTSGTLSVSGTLGTVTVSDTRNLFASTWTASVASTDFTTGSATASETVAKTNVAYVTGLPTSSTGTGAFTPVGAPSLAVAGVAGAWLGVGNNTVSWDPTIAITLSPTQFAGTYTGVITHSVA